MSRARIACRRGKQTRSESGSVCFASSTECTGGEDAYSNDAKIRRDPLVRAISSGRQPDDTVGAGGAAIAGASIRDSHSWKRRDRQKYQDRYAQNPGT